MICKAVAMGNAGAAGAGGKELQGQFNLGRFGLCLLGFCHKIASFCPSLPKEKVFYTGKRHGIMAWPKGGTL